MGYDGSYWHWVVNVNAYGQNVPGKRWSEENLLHFPYSGKRQVPVGTMASQYRQGTNGENMWMNKKSGSYTWRRPPPRTTNTNVSTTLSSSVLKASCIIKRLNEHHSLSHPLLFQTPSPSTRTTGWRLITESRDLAVEPPHLLISSRFLRKKQGN